MPATYTLRLFDAVGHELEADGDARAWSCGGSRTTFRWPASSSSASRAGRPRSIRSTAYHLACDGAADGADIALWFDEGWLDDTEVYKLIPDAAGSASRTWVDVVAE